MTINHFRDLRQYDQYRDAVIFIYAEANMSWVVVDQIRQLLHENAHIVGQHEVVTFRDIRPGVITTEATKEAFVEHAKALFQNGLVRYSTLMVGMEDMNGIRRDFEEQLRIFNRSVKAPADISTGKHQVVYSGKSGSTKDDLIMAFYLFCWWGFEYEKSAKFQAQAAQLHMRPY